MSGAIPCSVLVLTRNAAETLHACLDGLKEFAQVIVLDGRSTDHTREIASSYQNVTLRDQPTDYLDADGRIRDFAAVRNAGLKVASQPWLMFVDADEILTPELVASIRAACASGSYDAYTAFRRFRVNGEWVMRAAAYPALHVRLVKKSMNHGFGKPVHERFDLKPGARVGALKGDLLIPLAPPKALWPKYRRYLAIEAERASTLPLGQWLYWVLWWNIRSLVSYALRLLWVCLTPGGGKKLPFAYEMQFLAYPFLLIVETSPLHRLPFGQFITYLCTGGAATFINVGLYWLLLRAGVWYIGASIVAEVFGFISAFIFHKYVAFRAHGDHAKHFVRYCLLGLWNLCASTALLWLFVDVVGIGPFIAKIIVIICMVAWNFLAYKFVVYR